VGDAGLQLRDLRCHDVDGLLHHLFCR
jgi:hypothetical protein